MIKTFTRFTQVQTAITADQRRSRLLKILLLGVAAITILALLILAAASLLNLFPVAPILFVGTIAMIIGIGICLWLNHQGNVILSSSIFLAFITVVFAFVDTPTEVVKGRTLFMFVIPILMASFLLRPYASFVITAVVAVLHIYLAFATPVADYTPIGLTAFLVIALVAWLAAGNLEVAMTNLQETNQDLDQRVGERTQELAGANIQLKSQALELANANLLLEQQAHNLVSANDRLQELNSLKSKFVSDVSHELRTPISNLSIYLEMMESGNQEKNERYLNVLREETSRLEKLVTDVLNLSRMEIGAVKEELKWVDLNEVASRVVLANQVRAVSHGLEVKFDPGETLPEVWANSDHINQVINNLVGNAINYTSEGSILVDTWLDAEQQRVGLRVKDTGYGIADEDIPHLFERFYRGQQGGQSSIPGTGLGLAITKEIITRHQGSIEVQSKVGVGTTFTIYLPVRILSSSDIPTEKTRK